ncbi:type 1 glutamine amidotransferase [Bisbaumannia pacifica]|uniref:Type 1 glutamine amidotransferase n=1 Tax=Bisbaumannia pacifica TaxID=77098 RepID=A0ABD4L4I7_9GAMM|nr:type 1 glutamine amidotransferase [Halomonas pacifica]MBH8581665.1 type 1 glutamine amidotransferase [Halomonas pacifica]
MSALRLCILENGLVPEPLDERFAGYPAMIEAWLGPALPEASFEAVAPVSGEALPDPAAFDGYLLTGSKHSVYEGADWMRAEIDFLRRARDLGRPIFGICFGHQLMADAFGGRTAKAGAGWGLGGQDYRRDEGAEAERGAGRVLAFHQDQVVELPPQARVLAGSDHCPHGVLNYAFPALSVQYHPEFTPAYVEALLDRYGGHLFDQAEAQAARASLSQTDLANAEVAAWVARFFREAGVSASPATGRATPSPIDP